MKKTILIVAATMLSLPAVAQQAPAAGPERHPCKEVIAQLCPGVQPGGGRIKACLQQQGKTMEQVCPEAAAKHEAKKGEQTQGGVGAPPSSAPPSSGAPSSGAPVALPPIAQ